MATLPTGIWLDFDPTVAGAALTLDTAIASLAIPGHPAAAQATGAKQPLIRAETNNTKTFRSADFDGVDDSLSLSGTALNTVRNITGLTVLMVTKQDTAPGAAEQQVLMFSTAASGSTRRWSYGHGSGGQVVSGRRLDSDVSDTFRQTVAPVVGQWQVRTATMNYAAATASLHRDGTSVAADAAWLTAGTVVDAASLTGFIGSLSTSQYLDGRIARILVWQRALSDAERAAAHTVIQDTYGITVADYVPASLGAAGADQTGILPGETVVLQGTGAGTWALSGSSPSGVTVTIEPTGVTGQATFEWPWRVTDTVLTFTYGGDSMTVSGLRAQRRIRTSTGTWRPVRRRVVQIGDLSPIEQPPDDTVLLPVVNAIGFQKPGTRVVRLEWDDPNLPPAARYNVTETAFGGLDIYVPTPFRESGNLAPGEYLYHVAPESATGARGAAVDIAVTVVGTGGPTVTSDAPVVGPRTYSIQHTAIAPASTIAGAIRLSADSTATPVATYALNTATGGPVTESYANLEPSTTYYRTATFTRADTGVVTTRSSTFTTSAPAASLVKYERLGPVLATDTSAMPSSHADWDKWRILTQTTVARTPAGSTVESPTQGFSGGLAFAAGTNNLVIGPRNIAMARVGGLTLSGGHHLSVRNIEVDHKWGTVDTSSAGGVMSKRNYFGIANTTDTMVSYSQSQRKGMQFLNQTGSVEGEGLWIHGEALNDAIWPNLTTTTIAAPAKRYATFQHCWFGVNRQPNRFAQFGGVDDGTGNPWGLAGVIAWGGTGNNQVLHADSVQPMGDGTNTVFRFYKCRWDTAYQGFMDNMGGEELEVEQLLVNAVYMNGHDTALRVGYSFFFNGPFRAGPGVVVRNPVRLNGFSQQRQVGYPETVAKWAGITQIVTTTPAVPSWNAEWTGDKAPGRNYVVA